MILLLYLLPHRAILLALHDNRPNSLSAQASDLNHRWR